MAGLENSAACGRGGGYENVLSLDLNAKNTPALPPPCPFLHLTRTPSANFPLHQPSSYQIQDGGLHCTMKTCTHKTRMSTKFAPFLYSVCQKYRKVCLEQVCMTLLRTFHTCCVELPSIL